MAEMTFTIEDVTPEIAAKWLQRNEGNRKLRETRAAAFAKAITDGKYRLTHQGIAFSSKGRLLDGQHRLRAICLANRTIPIVVARNVPESAFDVLDAGMTRKMYERLRTDAKATTVATRLYRMMVGKGAPQEYEIATMMDIIGKALLKVQQVTGPNKKKGGTIGRATQEAAIVLRMAMAMHDKDEDTQLNINWKLEKLRRGDLVGAPPIIASYHQQLTKGVQTYDITVSSDVDDFARAWRAFDRARESVTKLQIDDHSAVIREARDVFGIISQGIFA